MCAEAFAAISLWWKSRGPRCERRDARSGRRVLYVAVLVARVVSLYRPAASGD